MKRVYKWIVDGLEFPAFKKQSNFVGKVKQVQLVFMELIGTGIV